MSLLASVTVMFALMQAPLAQPPASFAGTFKGFESGHIVIEVASGNNMVLFVTGSTKYFREGKKSKPAEFHSGDHVQVDAERDMRMNMVALRVEEVKAPAETPGDGEKVLH